MILFLIGFPAFILLLRGWVFATPTLFNSENPLATKNIPSYEYNALYNIYYSLNGPYWQWTNDSETIPWNFSTPSANPCVQKWQGLSCNCISSPIYCYIDQIGLSSHNLSGRCPDSFAQFHYLTALLLVHNNISGTIPSVLFENLTELTAFDIRSNQFYGTIPANINRLTELQLLALETNFLTGPIPEELFELSNLQLLFLQNNLLNGSISASIGNLSSILEISLSTNDLKGTLPSSIGNLDKLIALDLRFNYLIGNIPSSFGSLAKLLQLSLTGNRLSQQIPSELGNLTKLKTVNLDLNIFTGSIPLFLVNLPDLIRIFLNDNKFYGSLPAAIFNSTNSSLLVLSIGANLFTGTIPDSIVNWKNNLGYLDLTENSFHGTFPMERLDSFEKFRSFLINVNFFEGSLHNPLPLSPALLVFNIGGNAFTGTVPVSNWTLITNYLAYDAYFASTIPEEFSNYNRLNYIEISDNYLIGTIPRGISQLNLLGYLNLTNNLLTGSLNDSFSAAALNSKIIQLSISYNYLTGPIPNVLGKIKDLSDLALNDNQLTGPIPLSFHQLLNLQILLLQNNQLTGRVFDFKIYQLQNLDVSGNLLTGTLPDLTVFIPTLKTFAASSNCITGSIPDSFCVSSLSVLTLDGLSTATNCRTDFFPGSTIFNAFYVDSYLRQGIPTCLFSMESIETLHLSGNGLTGSLPSNLNISKSLTDLSLSHNQLSGSIPLAIQAKAWTRLELSYNKFSGTLSDDFHNYDMDGTSLSLKINRLSGRIPSSLMGAKDIDMLQGNLFSCNIDRTGLPKNDDSSQTYSCGSDVVNTSIYIWIGANSLFVITLYILIRTARLRNRKSKQDTEKKNDIEKELEEDEVEEDHEAAVSRALRPSRTSFATSLLAPNMEAMIERVVAWRKKIIDFKDEDENTQVAIASIHLFLKPLRLFIFRIILFTLLILGFIYVGVSLTYNAYTYPYAWTYSAIFLSGQTPAIAILIPLFILLMIVIHLYRVMVENPSALFTGDYRTSKRFFKFLKSMNRINEEEKIMIYCVLVVVVIANFMIMMVVDIVYVVIILNYSPAIVISTEICLAIFKLWFNNVFLWKIFPFARKYLKPFFIRLQQRSRSSTMNRPESIQTDTGAIQMSLFARTNSLNSNGESAKQRPESVDLSEHSSSSSSLPGLLDRNNSALSINSTSSLNSAVEAYQYSRTELLFLARTVVFNNVLFPILAIFIVNPECFFNSLFAADDEKTSYSYQICDRSSRILGICQNQLLLTEESSYTPPFIYGYECASNILVNYVPVFIMMYTWEGFLSPLLKMTLKFVIDRLFNEESQILRTHSTASIVVAPGEFTLSDLSPSTSSPRNTEGPKSSSLASTTTTSTNRSSIFSKSSWLFRFLDSLLPDNLQEFIPIPPRDRARTFFDKNRLAVKINTGLVVLVSFGALFPPLAFIVGFGVITLTLYEETVIGRLLYQSERLGYTWYKKQLERDCYGLAESLKYTLWSVIPVSSLLFAYLIFDTWGDAEGWLAALPATVLMGTLPTLILIGVIYGRDSCRYVQLKVNLFLNRSVEAQRRTSAEIQPPTNNNSNSNDNSNRNNRSSDVPPDKENQYETNDSRTSESTRHTINLNRPLPTPKVSNLMASASTNASLTSSTQGEQQPSSSLSSPEERVEIVNPVFVDSSTYGSSV